MKRQVERENERTILNRNDTQYPDESLDDLTQSRQFDIPNRILRFSRSSYIFNHSGQKLADAELENPRSARGGIE